jgi:hypothetical protein
MLICGNLNSFCGLKADIAIRISPRASSIKAVTRNIHPSKVFGRAYPKEGLDFGIYSWG